MSVQQARRPLPTVRAPLRRTWRTGLIALALALVAGLSLAVLPAVPAHAVDDGPHYADADNGGLGRLGAWRVGGTNIYCLEMHTPLPAGAPPLVGYGGWLSLSDDQVARLNWAISTYGQSSDRRRTAAVQLYVWWVADRVDYDAHGMSGDEWFLPRTGADQAQVASILAEIRSRAAGIVADPGPPGSAALQLTADPVDHYAGEVVVTGFDPARASGLLQLEHGIFDATGSASLAGAVAGQRYAVTAVPPAGVADYRVAVHGDFTWDAGYAGELAIRRAGGTQTFAGPGRSPATNFALAATDASPRSTVFRPVVSTEVPAAEAASGDRFADVLRFAVQADPDSGLVNRWARRPDGQYVPVTASCRVYGPLREAPAPAPDAPAGTPLASTFVVTTGPDGPEAAYPVESEQPITAPGFYTAVCSIDLGAQVAATRVHLPAGYRYQDGYGLSAELLRIPAPAAPPAPELAETGIDDPVPLALTGIGLAAIGLLLRVWRRLRVG